MIATARKTIRMGRRARDPDLSTFCGRFAARLKQLRLKAGMDRDRAADAITAAGYPVTIHSLYGWEAGRSAPPYYALEAIAAAYRTSIRSLLPPE